MTYHPTGLFAEDFLRADTRAVMARRRIHLDKSDAGLAHAPGQARGLTEPSGPVRLVEAASLNLGNV